MKRAALLLACFSLHACSTPTASPKASIDDAAPKPLSCPTRVGTDMHTQLPEPHFLPAAPAGAALVLPARLRDNSPVYPSASRHCREEGKVMITYCVATDGLVENVQVVVSSGYARLDNAVLGWAATDRHRPGTVNGQPRRYCGLTIERLFEHEIDPANESAGLSASGAR
jgi:protein TonB